MNVWRTIATAFAMFSRLPMPRLAWRDENMRYMLCAFPLVGGVIGLALWGWIRLGSLLGIGPLLFAAGLVLIPAAVTGGIHLDGFADTVDALASHAEPARKREILKDPHSGAFAVLGVCAYLLLYFALGAELAINSAIIWLLALMHVLSRILSGLSILYFPTSAAKGLLSTFKEAAAQKRAAVILLILLLFCAAGMIVIDWRAGGVMLAVALACLVYLFRMSRRQFGGMSGDLAGYFLQIAELAMLAGLVGWQKILEVAGL